jgi:hypothetical protein
LNRIRAPFNVTSAGQAAAIAALADTEFVAHSRKHNIEWREWMAGEIASLSNHGLKAIPSWANFLMVIFEGKTSAETVYKDLMDEGYIVRWLPGQGLANGLRITIGSEEENLGVMAALRKILEAAQLMLPFARVSIIGLGLIGSSVARAVKANMPGVRVTGFDADPEVRDRARDLGFCDDVADTAGTAVIDAGWSFSAFR